MCGHLHVSKEVGERHRWIQKFRGSAIYISFKCCFSQLAIVTHCCDVVGDGDGGT